MSFEVTIRPGKINLEMKYDTLFGMHVKVKFKFNYNMTPRDSLIGSVFSRGRVVAAKSEKVK